MTETQIELLRLCSVGEQTFSLESTEEIDCVRFDRQAEEIFELAEHRMIELAFHYNEVVGAARHYTKIKVYRASETGLKHLQQEDDKRLEKVRAAQYLKDLEDIERIGALERTEIAVDIRNILEDDKLFHNQKVELALKLCREIIKADAHKKSALSQHAS